MDTTLTRRAGRRGSSAALAGALLISAGGCQSYEPRPLDLAGHRAAFVARMPDAAEISAFAAGLSPDKSQGLAAFDLADGVTAMEAEIVAVVFNAELRMARLRAGVTQATAENAGLWEDPTIGVDLTRIIQSTPDPWKVFSSIGLTLPISGRLGIEKQRAGVEHAVALARVAQQEWNTRMAVRRAWTEWSAFESQLVTTREFVGQVDQVLSVVDMMEQAGELVRTEARLFRIERATKLSELALLESRVQESSLRLRQLMGLAPEAPVTFQMAGIGPPARARSEDAGHSLRESMEARSPAMQVAIAEYEAAEKDLELEIRRQYPDLHIGPGYGREDGQDQILLGLSVPIPILNANRRGIAEARARRELARAGAETALEQLIAMLYAAEIRSDAAARQRATLESEIVPLVEAQFADARHAARLGEVNTLVLLDSLTRQQNAKVRLVEARRDEALASIERDELLGPQPASSLPIAPENTGSDEPPAS